MAFDYECDFYLQAQRLTPITKRQDVRLGMLKSISKPLQWNRDNFFEAYLTGDVELAWDSGTNYNRYERVNYLNKIYESTNPNFIDGTPKPNLNNLPTEVNSVYWTLVVSDFRGATERIKYNCQKLMLEWILNRWFGTTFLQPPATSDFYIVTNTREVPTFTVPSTTYRDNVYVSNEIFQLATNTKKFVKAIPSYATTSNFTVYYPLTTIGSTSADGYFEMQALINKYKILGSTADYVAY